MIIYRLWYDKTTFPTWQHCFMVILDSGVLQRKGLVDWFLLLCLLGLMPYSLGGEVDAKSLPFIPPR